jgi:hypothetical protein
MSRAAPKMRDLAERLIAYEAARGTKSSGAKIPAACLVIDRLRPQLATLMGNIGFRALLSRTLALANPDFPWLRAVHVKAEGSLEGLDELAEVDPDEIFEGCSALLAQLLELLAAFIGKDLTLQLVREVWPNLPRNNLAVGKGDR